MSGAAPEGARPAPRGVLVLALVVTAIAGWFLITRTNVSPAARTCGQLYAEARTASDSAAVDATAPDSARPAATCGGMRTNARW